MAITIERPFPEDGDLAASILDGIAAHGLAPVTSGTAVDAYPQGRYWSVFCALNETRDVLWVAPLTSPESFTNLDYAPKTAIAVMPTFALHLDYDAQLEHIAQVLRDAAQRLAGPADAAPIPFFLMDAHEVVSPCGVGLLGRGNQVVVLQGMRGTTVEIIVMHAHGLSTVSADSYGDFGRATHWPWADLADLSATSTTLTVKLHAAPAPLLWRLGMSTRPASPRDLETIASARAEHCATRTPPTLRTFASASERDTELSAVCSAMRVPADFEPETLVQRYGLPFVIDVLRKLPRNLYFAGYARPIIERLLAGGDLSQAREVAALAPPASRTGTFSTIVLHALAGRDHATALALIDELERERPADAKPLPGQWLLWKVASLAALGRLPEAERAAEPVRDSDSDDVFVHLAVACIAAQPERDQALARAIRCGLERLDAERRAWVTACGFGDDHPVSLVLARAETQGQRAREMANTVAAAQPAIFGNDVVLDSLEPARAGGVRLEATLAATVELPIEGTYISNLEAAHTRVAVRLGDGRLLLAARDPKGSLTVRSTLPGPYRAPGASALAFHDNTLLIADEQRGLVLLDVRDLASPRELSCIPPRRTRGFSSLVVGNGRVAAFAGEALELLAGADAPRSHDAFDLPHNLGGAAFCREYLVVSAGPLLVAVTSDAAGCGIVSTLRLTHEALEAGRVFSFGDRVYVLAGPGVWRARVTANGTLADEGWLRLPFAARPTRVSMRETPRGVLMADVAFDRHVTLLTGPDEPFALVATARLHAIDDYFSATAWMGDTLVGASGRALHLIEVGPR